MVSDTHAGHFKLPVQCVCVCVLLSVYVQILFKGGLCSLKDECLLKLGHQFSKNMLLFLLNWHSLAGEKGKKKYFMP